MKLIIHRARIATFGEHVVDVFYVLDREGQKIESPRRHKTIETKLLAVLKEETSPAAKTRAGSARQPRA